MTRINRTRLFSAMLTKFAAAAAVVTVMGAIIMPCAAAESDWGKVAATLGKSGTEMPGGVYRVGLPRTDLHVVLDGVELKPGFALGSWLAFRADGNETVAMGDLVLTETEIAPVMTKLADGGIDITALHNHLLRAQPATFYMHVLGHGDATRLATALHDGLALSKTPLGDAGGGNTAGAQTIDLDTAMIDSALGAKGRAAGGIYQFGIARAETVKEGGMDVPVAMGSGEAINFQPTGNGHAAITGDFVLTAAEVNPVLRALRANGIEVTALHNHMLDDQPRLFFMHFWANNDAQKLAKGLRAALDKINITRS
jgi:hypothetical protein